MTTGATVARSQEAQSYLDRVGAALADLPEEERADMLDELGTHVDEIAAEGTSSLDARLGSPEDYAAHIDRDEKRWSVVVKASGAKAE